MDKLLWRLCIHSLAGCSPGNARAPWPGLPSFQKRHNPGLAGKPAALIPSFSVRQAGRVLSPVLPWRQLSAQPSHHLPLPLPPRAQQGRSQVKAPLKAHKESQPLATGGPGRPREPDPQLSMPEPHLPLLLSHFHQQDPISTPSPLPSSSHIQKEGKGQSDK